MNNLGRRVLVFLRGKRRYCYPRPEVGIHNPNAVQQLIYDKLVANRPCMIARFGSVELQALVDYLNPPTLKTAWSFLHGRIPAWGYAPSTLRTMRINAGFFPSTPQMLNRFGELMINCIPMVDVLGSWRKEESVIIPYLSHATLVPLHMLEPYYFDNPWTPALEGKRVLVIHPFKETIQKQHRRYRLLFEDNKLTPTYDLQIIKAVQSIAGNKPAEFDNWFQALDWMKEEIDKCIFDIAIIGCGAYGFPLAAYVKQIGKKAIHLGGAVQYLFGIWSNAIAKSPEMNKLKNQYWVRPSADETPNNIELVERSRYW